MKMRSRRSGQTLIVAILILGILLILGFAFAQIISRSISEAGRQNLRTVASDLARSGINSQHSQLVNSELGADYRPELSPVTFDAAGFSRDPDALYLRPGTGATIDLGNGETFVDLGGPDFKGAYSRTDTDKGRRLVRVRYAPGDFNSMTSPAPSGMRQPGKARNYILIESVGRPGRLFVNGRLDVSKQLPRAIQIANFVTMAEIINGVSTGRAVDAQHNVDQRKMKAYASIGIIDSLRFITNKNKVSRPAEIGVPRSRGAAGDPFAQSDLGVQFNDAPGGAIPVSVLTTWGYGPAAAQAGRPNWMNVPGGASLYSNASVKWYGDGFIALNRFLGENWKINGTLMPADPSAGGPTSSNLTIRPYDFNRATNQWQPQPYVVVSGDDLNSNRSNFSTQNGLLQDGAREDVDVSGNPRGVGRKEPPSILAKDPQSNTNRYQNMASISGPLVGNRNIGRDGYGRNVYIDSPERGNLDSEDERRQAAGVRNLPNDWLNPNNAGSLGWQGPFYVPVAAYLHLLPDGFEIIRDSRSRNRFWRRPTGGSTGESVCRYRVRYVDSGTGRYEMYIINSVETPALISAPLNSVTDADFVANGRPFGGVIYFEGDARVRGVIPTDIQLSVVSMGSIYIDGSITKGRMNIHQNAHRPGHAYGQILNRPSASMLMLMARDYVVLNTTQFFGPVPGASPAVKSTDVVADTPSPVELDIADSPELTLMAQFVTNPATGNPFATEYVAPSGGVAPEIFLSSSADDNGPSFLQLDVRPSSWATAGPDFRYFPFDTSYTFGATTVEFNAAAQYYGPVPPATIPIYGLGDSTINAYPRFETIGFPLTTGTTDVANNQIRSEGPATMYYMGIDDPTLFRLRMAAAGTTPPKNWLVGRAAIAPHDVRVEAAMFAEEGSFFVIPGQWFNTNPDDNRLDYNNGTGTYSTVAAADRSLHRYNSFGATPSTPFYAEPLDVRISIFGAISENMPAPMSQQVEWLKKWGWIPRELGESGVQIPNQHDPNGLLSDPAVKTVPNLILTYDPNLATATFDGATPVRTDGLGRVLPPMPRLPVSPTLAFIGDGE